MEKTKFEQGDLVRIGPKYLLGFDKECLSGQFAIVINSAQLVQADTFFVNVYMQNTQEYLNFYDWQLIHEDTDQI